MSYEKIFQDTSQYFSSKSISLREAWAKILIDQDSGLILGAHLMANHLEEMTNVFALAMRSPSGLIPPQFLTLRICCDK